MKRAETSLISSTVLRLKLLAQRKYFPELPIGDRETVAKQLENLLVERHLLGYIEAMTDQVEVFIKGRKVAIYMP